MEKKEWNFVCTYGNIYANAGIKYSCSTFQPEHLW